MNRYDALERELTGWFFDTAMPRTPDYTTDIVQLTATVRQRPRWTFLERWIPMSVITLVPRSARPVPWRALGALALMALLLAAAGIMYVASQNRLPPPFGLARNGLVAYSQHGDILTVDPGTGARTWITSGNEDDREARWSLDGTRIAFLRNRFDVPVVDPTTTVDSVVVVDLDGRVVAKSQPIGAIDPDAIAWAPDGRSIAIGGGGSLWLVDSNDGGLTRLAVGYLDLDLYWRPGDKRQILLRGNSSDGGRGLMIADLDDPGETRVVVPEMLEDAVRPNGWTPDGRRIVYTLVSGSLDRVTGIALHVLDITTGNDVEIDAAFGHVSNDGTRILALAGDRPCVVSIDGGPCDPIAPMAQAYEGTHAGAAQWAPDDRWILIRSSDESGRAFLLDPSGESQDRPAWPENGGESWQRRAR